MCSFSTYFLTCEYELIEDKKKLEKLEERKLKLKLFKTCIQNKRKVIL